MSVQGRGIFDGVNPPSTTFIFDDSIFDTKIALPIDQAVIIAIVHGNSDITALEHGNEAITLK